MLVFDALISNIVGCRMLVVAQDGSFYEVYSSKARILIFSKENNLSFRCLIHFWVFVRDVVYLYA